MKIQLGIVPSVTESHKMRFDIIIKAMKHEIERLINEGAKQTNIREFDEQMRPSPETTADMKYQEIKHLEKAIVAFKRWNSIALVDKTCPACQSKMEEMDFKGPISVCWNCKFIDTGEAKC